MAVESLLDSVKVLADPGCGSTVTTQGTGRKKEWPTRDRKSRGCLYPAPSEWRASSCSAVSSGTNGGFKCGFWDGGSFQTYKEGFSAAFEVAEL